MTTSFRDATVALIGVPVRVQTYKNLLYLSLTFPLSLLYFFGLTLGFTVGVSLALILIGLPILLGTLSGATVFASVEAELANRLLGTDIPTRKPDISGDIVESLKTLLADSRTWLDVVYLLFKSGFGIVSLVALVVLPTTAGSLLVTPLTYSSSYNIGFQFDTLSIGPFEGRQLVADTFNEAVLITVLGLVMLFISLHLLNALARISGIVTEALLTPSETN